MQRRSELVFFALVALLLSYSFPYFEAIHSANELPRAYLTQAIVDEGTLAIDTGVARYGATADVSPHGGHLYSNKAPGSSFLAVPGYLALESLAAARGTEPTLAETLWVARMTTGVIPTLLFLVLLYGFLERFAPSPEARRFVIMSYALGTMAMTYSVLFIAHQLSAVCIATSYIVSVRVLDDGKSDGWMLAAGFAAGAAPLVDYQAAFAGVPIAIYILWRALRRSSARRWRPVALAVLGAAVPVTALFLYHDAAFGSPLATGYGASKTFAMYHQKGFLGLDHFRWEALAGSFVSPDNGLLLFSPILLFALPGWLLMARDPRQRAHMSITASVVVIYVLFISSLVFWRGGWQMGPRYITAMLPFAMVPIAVVAESVDGRWPLRAALIGAALVGVAVYALSCAQYPHFPEKFANPLYEVTFRLWREGHAPYNAGWLLGLRGLGSLVPYLVLLTGLVAWTCAPARRYRKSALLGLTLAAGVVLLYSSFPGGGPPADQAYVRWVAGVMPS